MIQPHVHGDTVALPVTNETRWTIIERICQALAYDDDAAALMLQIADATDKKQRATYALMKLEFMAGITESYIQMSPVEARILADDLLYITPDPKEATK